MRTNDSRIFAVGDCARPDGRLERVSVAYGIRQAERVVAQLLGSPSAPLSDEDVLNREIDLCGFRFVTTARPSGEQTRSTCTVSRRPGRRAFSISFHDRHIISYQALLSIAQAARLVQRAESSKPVSAGQWLCLALGWIPRPRATADMTVCQCAGVSRSSILEAACLHGTDVGAIGQATGAGLYCGGCMDELAALAGTRSRRRWSTFGSGVFVLLLAAITAWLPAATPGTTAQPGWFAVYSLLTGYGVQQASGWLALGFIMSVWIVTAIRWAQCVMRIRRPISGSSENARRRGICRRRRARTVIMAINAGSTGKTRRASCRTIFARSATKTCRSACVGRISLSTTRASAFPAARAVIDFTSAHCSSRNPVGVEALQRQARQSGPARIVRTAKKRPAGVSITPAGRCRRP